MCEHCDTNNVGFVLLEQKSLDASTDNYQCPLEGYEREVVRLKAENLCFDVKIGEQKKKRRKRNTHIGLNTKQVEDKDSRYEKRPSGVKGVSLPVLLCLERGKCPTAFSILVSSESSKLEYV